MKPNLKKVMDAVDASADKNGDAILTSFVLYVSVQAVMTGSSTGTLKLQYSNDPAYSPKIPTNWSDIPNATVTIDAAGVFAIPKTDLCYEHVRPVYTKNNGSVGTLTAYMKTIGA